MPKHGDHNSSTESLISIQVHPSIAKIGDCWREFQQKANGGPHDTWEWNDAWVRTAGASDTPLIVVGRDANGEVLFLLPLTIRKRMGCAVLEWLSADQGNYASGLFHPSAWLDANLPRGRELLTLIRAALPRVDAVHLAAQPRKVGNFTNPLAGLPGVMAASAGHAFPLSVSWRAHYEKEFSSRQRSMLRRCERQLRKHGPLRFEAVGYGPRRAQIMDAMIGEKRLWFAEKGIPDVFANDGVRSFFRSLAQVPDTATGLTVKLFTLSTGDQSTATSLGLVFQNRFYGLLATTPQGPLRRYSPGRLLLLRLVEYLANKGIDTIDCGAGEDEDKLRWCTVERERLHAIVPVSFRGRIFATAMILALKSKRHIKQTPHLWCWAQRFRHWKSLMNRQPQPDRAAAVPSTVSRLKA